MMIRLIKRSRSHKEIPCYQGSFTVEYSLLFPIILFIIFASIYLTFYLYDICRIEGLVDKVLNKAALTVKHEADFQTGRVDYAGIGDRGVLYPLLGNTDSEEKTIRDYLWDELKEGFFLVEVSNIQVIVTNLKITISVEGRVKIPLSRVLEFFRPENRVIFEVERGIHNPAEFVRISEVVLDTGTKLKGLDSLKKK